MFFLLGAKNRFSLVVFPPAYSNQSQFKAVTMHCAVTKAGSRHFLNCISGMF